MSTCSQSLEKQNRRLLLAVKKLGNMFGKVASYIDALASASESCANLRVGHSIDVVYHSGFGLPGRNLLVDMVP